MAERAGIAVIISTHILPDVEAVCDDVLILSRGKLKLAGSLQALTTTAPELYLKILGSAEQLVDSLSRTGLNAAITDRGEIVVKDPRDVASIWSCARKTGVTIRSLTPAKNTLEEIFMEAVGEDEHANS